jgi:hypothetical protein
MLVMAQVVRDSSISVIDSARIIGAHASTIKTLLSSSNAGSTEWKRERQDSRSKTTTTLDGNPGTRVIGHPNPVTHFLFFIFLFWPFDKPISSTNYTQFESSRAEPLRRDFFPFILVRLLRPIGSHGASLSYGREERDSEVLRVLTGLFCRWMMTLNSGHDVSE